MKTVSIIVPVHDEQDTIVPLVEAVTAVFRQSLEGIASLSEIVIVDDGSRDQTWVAIQRAVELSDRVTGIRLRRNFGKAAALQEGIQASAGGVIITMDGDLQDDPLEIPRFLAKMAEGFDLVSGWKEVRHDPPGKTLPSKLFNGVTALVTGVRLHDFNCGFKAYDRRIFEDIRLYGELHRFMPALADHAGYRVGEISVTHHPRRFGRSKYGMRRLLKGFLDLLTVLTITRFSRRPGHLFGGLGVAMGALGGGMMLYLVILWFMGNAIGDRPLLILAVLLMIVGVQFLFFGMIAELLVNIDQRGSRGARSLAAEITRRAPAAGS